MNAAVPVRPMSSSSTIHQCGTQAHRPVALTVLSWVLQVAAAAILLQTLFFKFTGAPESVYIFTKVGAEPVGRIGSGVVELIAAVLLLNPRTAAVGGLFAAGVMAGAIGSHLTILGITIPNQPGPGDDGGLLFGLACVVMVASMGVVAIRRRELPVVGKRL